jgi:phosphopantothenoylcysteine decarboxylase/phosphopantothenate--cysteine ligase
MDNNNSNFDGQRVIIGLSGGIACYKVADLVSALVQSNNDVDVVMTEAATRFIAPLTFESLTGKQVFDSQWKHINSYEPQHIKIATHADIMLIAPCTMDMLAKLANGHTDDPVTLVASAIDKTTTPIIVAPSMNTTMFSQGSTQRNLQTLADDGFTILDCEEGWQACRAMGTGRLPEPDTLLDALQAALSQKSTVSY